MKMVEIKNKKLLNSFSTFIIFVCVLLSLSKQPHGIFPDLHHSAGLGNNGEWIYLKPTQAKKNEITQYYVLKNFPSFEVRTDTLTVTDSIWRNMFK